LVSSQASEEPPLHGFSVFSVLVDDVGSVLVVAFQDALQECLVILGCDRAARGKVLLVAFFNYFSIEISDTSNLLICDEGFAGKLATVGGVINFFFRSVRCSSNEMGVVVDSIN